MKVGILNICSDSVSGAMINPSLGARLIEQGIDTIWSLNATRPMFDYAFNMCYSAGDGIIVVGQVKSFLSFLKARFNQEFKESVFTFDGIKFVIIKSLDSEDVDELIASLTPTKSKAKIMRFGVFGKSIDQLQTILADLIANKSRIKFDFLSDSDSVFVFLRVPAKVEDIVLSDMSAKIMSRLADNIYHIKKDTILAQVATSLKNNKLKIALAESYTAGGIASALCSIEGASEYLQESMVCYSNDSKQKRLGVERSTILQYGAVSDEVVYEMAAGLLASNPECDIVLATTGYASRSVVGGDDNTGKCFVAIGNKSGIYIYKKQFFGSRQDIIKMGVNDAIFRLYKMLDCSK